MKIIFCSLNVEWITEVAKLFPEFSHTTNRVETLSRDSVAFVSPANCLGFMDGGIDYVYSRDMFPKCEKIVKSEIGRLGFKTNLGRPYFPIGSAFCISVGDTTGLICAPTMFLPHDVSTTRNAYHSFLASLLVFRKVALYETLVVTSHCCGYGKMSAAESARQMREAYDDFISITTQPDSSPEKHIVLMPLVNDTQPDNYDNREIKEIRIESLIRNCKK